MKKIIALIALLQLGIIVGAKESFSKEGVDVLVTKENTQNSAEPRSESISADITGHVLTISFNDNVGIAHIIIKDSNGVYIDNDNVLSTPDHATFIINDSGHYRMDIKNQDDMMKDLVQNCVITTIDNNIKIYLKEGNADITFYNTLGVAVKQSVLNEGENIINAEDLKAGVYIWKTSSNNIVNSGKFIKK